MLIAKVLQTMMGYRNANQSSAPFDFCCVAATYWLDTDSHTSILPKNVKLIFVSSGSNVS